MYENFYEFQEVCEQFFEEQKYEKVLNLLHQANDLLSQNEYENKQFELLLQEAMVYTELSDEEACIEIVKKCLEKGYAFPLSWKRFEFLKKYVDYEKIYSNNEILHKALRKNSRFEYKVHLPLDYKSEEKSPVFICLHGDGFGCSMSDTQYRWKPDVFLEKKYIVVYVQSSQTYCHNCYGWLLDLEKSRNDLENIFKELLQTYNIDVEQVIVGGFSGGASMAIDLAYHRIIPVKGVIALCPGDHLEIMSVKNVRDMVLRKIKIVMVEGEKALDPVVIHLLKVFQQSGLPYRYHVEQCMGHDYPKDLCIKTLSAINFIEDDSI